MMSKKERARLEVMVKIKKQGMKLSEASEMLDLSYRQTLRIYRRYGQEGDVGLTHRSRGQASNRARDAQEKKQILERYQERYSGFGPTFAVEKLAQDGYGVDHETLRGWLKKAGLWQKRRRRKEHRQWRARKEHFGELVQMDGSPHPWFGPDGEAYCLLNMVDDPDMSGPPMR
ncbi:MAG: helix-turn-helix domain-containing protein [Acidobacteria bacterium]|nr:helix-turn-helix domain-containing protein [Acidobacteriota bacterium]MBI3656706.1 helix-turn-helix domain-containing protein [Acidobacteriota bacterium]